MKSIHFDDVEEKSQQAGSGDERIFQGGKKKDKSESNRHSYAWSSRAFECVCVVCAYVRECV